MLILINENACKSWLENTFEEFSLLTLTFRQSLRVKRKIACGNIFAKATVNTSSKHWRASRLTLISFKAQVSSAYWGQKPSISRQFCPCFSWNCGSAAWTQPLVEGILSNTPFKFSPLLYSLISSFNQTVELGFLSLRCSSKAVKADQSLSFWPLNSVLILAWFTFLIRIDR